MYKRNKIHVINPQIMHIYLPSKHSILTMLLLRSNIRADVNWALRLGLMGLLSTSYLLANAQQNASINGVIKDETGKPIPSATVTIRNATSGMKKTTTSRPTELFHSTKFPLDRATRSAYRLSVLKAENFWITPLQKETS